MLIISTQKANVVLDARAVSFATTIATARGAP